MENKPKSLDSTTNPKLGTLIPRAVMSGAVAGSISGGSVFLGLIILVSVSDKGSTNFPPSDTVAGLVFACGLGALPGLIAGMLMGFLLGIIDGLFKLNLSDPSHGIGFWLPVGTILGGVGGALFFGLLMSTSTRVSGESMASIGLMIGLLFGGISGVIAGPLFGLIYRDRERSNIDPSIQT
ncbi:MAG TPA: hypothetical protein PLD25_10525 [Chloroflexota bacterium]|nr:hypothetical protein [Chloroflexota bacterium]HUM67543.1 hypothetical protein [Chloroflexota bacterium]